MKESAYKEAGVDIKAAADLVETIKPHIRKTHRPGVMSNIGGFGALFDLKETRFEDPVLVSATDGVGTKIKIAIELDRHDMIGIDAVAMCVNDIIVQGAEPLFFLDYFATGKLVNIVAETVIASVAEGCQQAGCALIGGETAEMPGLYTMGDYDLAGFCVGAVERDEIITGERVREGDIILGLASNGLHSNGFSLVRKLIKSSSGFDYESRLAFEPELSLGEMILMPTRIYVRSILEALNVREENGQPAIHGMAHITGGGLFENIPRAVPEDYCARLNAKNWDLPPIFRWLAEIGDVSYADMATTLNCGIGMAIICHAEKAAAVAETLKNAGETVFEIGVIEKKDAGKEPIIIDNLESAWG